jgi:Fe-S-cluster-containing dehydrogenase component
MVVDLDRCIGCQACVIACQAENNVPLNTKDMYDQRRAHMWIRIERYWEGEFPNVKARYMPVLCQHCTNAPCEPVCPVYATYHNNEGLNVQVYNRCVGTRYCANNCPYQVRFFNFWEPIWPESLRNQLNPDVTVRSRGIMEKCTFCVQRIRRAQWEAARESAEEHPRAPDEMFHPASGTHAPACVRSCPTDTLVFGDLNNPESMVSRLAAQSDRKYLLLDHLETQPSVIYLKKVDPEAAHANDTH